MPIETGKSVSDDDHSRSPLAQVLDLSGDGHLHIFLCFLKFRENRRRFSCFEFRTHAGNPFRQARAEDEWIRWTVQPPAREYTVVRRLTMGH